MKISIKKVPQQVIDSIVKSLGYSLKDLEFMTEKKVLKPKFWLVNHSYYSSFFNHKPLYITGYSSLQDMTWVLEDEGKLSDWSVFDNTGKHSLFTIKQVKLGLTEADF